MEELLTEFEEAIDNFKFVYYQEIPEFGKDEPRYRFFFSILSDGDVSEKLLNLASHMQKKYSYVIYYGANFYEVTPNVCLPYTDDMSITMIDIVNKELDLLCLRSIFWLYEEKF